MRRTAISKNIIRFFLFTYLLLQVFAAIHIAGHKIDFEYRIAYSQPEKDPLHDSDDGCKMIMFLNFSKESSGYDAYFHSYISELALIIPRQTESYTSVSFFNFTNKAPPSFS